MKMKQRGGSGGDFKSPGGSTPDSPVGNTKKKRRTSTAGSGAGASSPAVQSQMPELIPPPMSGFGDTIVASNPFDDSPAPRSGGPQMSQMNMNCPPGPPMGPGPGGPMHGSPIMNSGGPPPQQMPPNMGGPNMGGHPGGPGGPMMPMQGPGGPGPMPPNMGGHPGGPGGPGGPMMHGGPGQMPPNMGGHPGGPGGPMMHGGPMGPGGPMQGPGGPMQGPGGPMQGPGGPIQGPGGPHNGPMNHSNNNGMAPVGMGQTQWNGPPKPMPMQSGKIYPHDQPMVFNPQNPNAPPIYPCGVCHKEVHDNDQAIPCESGCNFWFHRVCTGLTEHAYHFLTQEVYAEWVCDKCLSTKNIPLVKFKP